MNQSLLAAGAWCWHDDYYAGRWSLLDQPAGAASAGLTAIECNDFMLPPPRLSRLRRPLLRLLPGATLDASARPTAAARKSKVR